MSEPCPHVEWSYDHEHDRWEADNLEAVHAGVTTVWCSKCGEYRFLEAGAWIVKVWTLEEIADMKIRAAELRALLNLPEED